MIQFASLLIAIVLAVTFAGFLAWKVDAAPLIVIVTACMALMIYGLYNDAFR